MSFPIIFDGKEKLKELENNCITIQKGKTANLTNIEGRNAEFDDGKKKNVNVASFEPVNKKSEVRKNLVFVEKAKADFAKMAAEGRTPVGGDMNVFIENQAVAILVFGKMT